MMRSSCALDGAPNFRDFGGWQAANGAHVRKAHLFRSDALARLTDADLVTIASLNIGLLYDLRGADERERHPNRWPNANPVDIRTGFDANGMAAVHVFHWRERISDLAFDERAAHAWMLQAYTNMPALFAPAVTSLFEQLAAPSASATLVHCTAGKDRTGFVCAMLQLALGVAQDDVFADYLLSNQLCPPEALLQALLGDEFAQLRAATAAAMRTMARVEEAYLGAALQTIEHDFGGLNAYFEQACGLSAARRSQLYAGLLV
jgi:protein-tyrosine phosphatase